MGVAGNGVLVFAGGVDAAEVPAVRDRVLAATDILHTHRSK